MPPTLLEFAGTLLCFGAVALLVSEAGPAPSSSSSSAATATDDGTVSVAARPATVAGDLAGLLASAALAIYFVASGAVRKRLGVPLFSWLWPLHAVAALLTTVLGVALESDLPGYLGPFAWAGGDGYVFGIALGSALTAGMLGHGIANLVMSQLSPLIVSVSFLGQPLLATLIGYGLGLQAMPSALAFVAAPLLIGGAFLTTIGARERGLSVADVLRCRIAGR